MSMNLVLMGLAALAPSLVASEPAAARPSGGDLIAIRVGRAETVSHGVIEHAVILIEKGKIVTIGQDLPIERGIRVVDRPDWVVMPGLVNPYSRLGLDGRAGADFTPQISPKPEIYPLAPEYKDVLEAGVTTLGIYPPGTSVPGEALVVRPHGKTPEEMLLREKAYLKIYFRSDARSKKTIRDAFEKADEYVEKEKKAREKWDKDQEKTKKKPADKKEEEKKGDEKGGEKKEEKKEEKKDGGALMQDPEGATGTDDPPAAQDEKKEEKKEEAPKTYVAPEPDEKVKPFLDLRAKKIRALVSIGQASDYLHWIDAIGKEEFEWDLRVPMTRELDLYEVKDQIGKKGCRIVLEPELTLHPGTMRQRNLPAELAKAGAKLVLVPRNDTVPDHKQWLRNVGEIITAGLERDVALRAVTLEPAGLLGLAERVGSLDKGKDANLLFLSGDPFEVQTQVKAVMLEGRFVFGEVQQ